MMRTLLFILLVCSTTATNCPPAPTVHKIIVAGMTAPGVAVIISLAQKTVKKIVPTAESEVAAPIQNAATNNCHWLRPQ